MKICSGWPVTSGSRRHKAVPTTPTEGGTRGPAHCPEGLSLAGPFRVEQSGTSGHEVRDANGDVFCWAADRPRALILAGLLEHACG